MSNTVITAGISGFGRYALNHLKTWLDDHTPSYEIVYINDERLSAEQMYTIVRTDTLCSFEPYKVTLDGKTITFQAPNGRVKQIVCTTTKSEEIPWLGETDIVLECSGERTRRERCQFYLVGNTKVVVISATSYDADAVLLDRWNSHAFHKGKHKAVSFGSCTVNAFVPFADFVNEKYGVLSASAHVIHNVQVHRLDAFNTLQRKFCTLEKVGPQLLTFLGEENFTVSYTVVPYTGTSIFDFQFRFARPPSTAQLRKDIQEGLSANGPLCGLYNMVPTDTGPEAHVRSPFSAVFVEENVRMVGDTAFLHSYFYNEGTSRYHGLVTSIASKL